MYLLILKLAVLCCVAVFNIYLISQCLYLIPAAVVCVLLHYHKRLVFRGPIAQMSAGVLYSVGPCGLYSRLGYDPRGSKVCTRTHCHWKFL